MPRQLQLRSVTPEAEEEIRRLARSRTEPARLVQRAQVVCAMLEDPELPAGRAGRLAGYESEASGCTWVRRFNDGGVEALEDRRRSGRPRTHSEEVRSALVDLATQKPSTLGHPFELWTLERLQRAFEEKTGTRLSDSTIWTWLRDEGLKWKRQESWFHETERHDPEFAEKRDR